MLISIIKFEIATITDGLALIEEFIIENTYKNQDKINAHRHTRNIRFDKMQDFQFANENIMPRDFIEADVWAEIINEDAELFAMVAEINALPVARDAIEIDYTKDIEYGQLWNCCWGNETHVIVFDNGSRHAVCNGCASKYTGPVAELTK